MMFMFLEAPLEYTPFVSNLLSTQKIIMFIIIIIFIIKMDYVRKSFEISCRIGSNMNFSAVRL